MRNISVVFVSFVLFTSTAAAQTSVSPAAAAQEERTSGNRLYLAGLVLELTGLCLVVPGAALLIIDFEWYSASGIALEAVGATAVVTAFPLVIIGAVRRHRAQRALALAPTGTPTRDGGFILGLSGVF